MATKAKVAVHKFSSCDGCQLAFLNLGEDLLTLTEQVEIVHFAEAGPVDEDTPVDIAFVEGSISTADDLPRIERIRRNSRYLISIGACATSGGIQALRNMADTGQWIAAIYASPEYIHSLDESTAIARHVKVDFELWGCPVNQQQILTTVRALLSGVLPLVQQDSLCQECKRKQTTCVMVTKGEPCLGPVTRGGCGVLCPSLGRACYGCYGPAENTNGPSLLQWFEALGLDREEAARRFHFIHSDAPAFQEAGLKTTAGPEHE
jgi:coenzyme F420-reducing hydrogenase gamma subunit